MTNKEFFLALEVLESEKGIAQQDVIDAFETAIATANKHETGESGMVSIKLTPEKNQIKFYLVKDVVEEVTDADKQISLEEAQEIKKSYKLGDQVIKEFTPKDFSRVAAQTVKQMLSQKIREIEKINTLNEFENKEDEILTCIVRRVEDKNVFVELGSGQIEGILMPNDQVPGEKYELGAKLKVYVKRVRNIGNTAQIVVSRTANGLVKRLFESEVPEIRQGVVQIKSIAREAGQRTKIAIYSDDPTVDAVGACVGMKGVRVNPIVQELGGEKIDIIPWSEEPLEFIAKALSPAKVIKVIQLDDENCARVIVPDDKLSLAIGRDGQNARLASRLTGWKIDVKSESSALALGDNN